MSLSYKPVYHFGDVKVDTSRGCLSREGQERYLRPQSFHALVYLLEQRGRLVTKDELLERIWNDAAVTDNAIVQCIAEVRRAIGDDPRNPRFIKTVPKSGYRFVCEVGESQSLQQAGIDIERIESIEVEYEEEEITGEEQRPSAARGLFASFSARTVLIVAVVLTAVTMLFASFAIRRSNSQTKAAQNATVTGRIQIAVIGFDNRTESASIEWLRDGLADILTQEFTRSGVTALNRQELDSIFAEGGHNRAAKISLDEALYMGRKARADITITGSFAKIDDDTHIEAQLYDTERGNLLATERLIIDDSAALQSQVRNLALKIMSDIGIEIGGDSGCAPPPSELVSWWPADGDATDMKGSHNGVARNGAAFAEGRVGQAFKFDSAGSFIEVKNYPSFGPLTPMSVEMWLYRTSASQVMHIAGKRAGCSGNYSEINFQVGLNNTSGQGLVFIGGTGMDLPLNRWTHVACTFDGRVARLYVDGLLVAKAPGANGPSNNASLKIGGSGNCSTFGGLIDELSIYGRALTTLEVQSIFKAGSAGKCKELP